MIVGRFAPRGMPLCFSKTEPTGLDARALHSLARGLSLTFAKRGQPYDRLSLRGAFLSRGFPALLGGYGTYWRFLICNFVGVGSLAAGLLVASSRLKRVRR